MNTEHNGKHELERLFSDLRAHTERVVEDRDRLKEMVANLQKECDKLQKTVKHLQERCDSYALIVRPWTNSEFPPEAAEAIMHENQWVTFEEVMQVANSVRDEQP